MALSITHTFVSAKSDDADTTLIRPSNWNAEHTITAAACSVIGRSANSSGAVADIAASANGQFLQRTSNALSFAAIASTDLPAGAQVQRVAASYATRTNVGATIPNDDTIPQSSEGTEILTVAISPKTTTNVLRVTFIGQFEQDAASRFNFIALFRDSTADALSAVVSFQFPGIAQGLGQGVLVHEFVPGSTSSTTLKIRVGNQDAQAMYLNGDSGARKFGGVSKAWLVIDEFVA